MRSQILATGSYLPLNEVKNEDLKQFPVSACALIEQKTGILARRYAADGESTSDLAAQAARACLGMAGMPATDVQAIILATSSPDRMQPSTAARTQHLLGAVNAFAFDVNSVCSGAIYALELGNALIKSGQVTNALVLASEVYSRILNPADFATRPYFGDGAGAVLLQASDRPAGILQTLLRTDGSGHDVIQVPAGGAMRPYAAMAHPEEQYFTMKGRGVFDFAVSRGPQVIAELLAALQLSKEDVAHVVSHQANINIIRAIAEATGIPEAKFEVNLERYGNTAAASVLIGLDELYRSGNLKPGELTILVAFGGGLSWAATALRF